jgi:hypothetical protein
MPQGSSYHLLRVVLHKSAFISSVFSFLFPLFFSSLPPKRHLQSYQLYTCIVNPILDTLLDPFIRLHSSLLFEVANAMLLLHIGPALVLGFSGLRLTIALPTQDPTASGGYAPTPSASEFANAAETVVLAGVPKFTLDNTCGNAKNGMNKGYTCDPKRAGGGDCCSEYVRFLVSQITSMVADTHLLQGSCGLQSLTGLSPLLTVDRKRPSLLRQRLPGSIRVSPLHHPMHPHSLSLYTANATMPLDRSH